MRKSCKFQNMFLFLTIELIDRAYNKIYHLNNEIISCRAPWHQSSIPISILYSFSAYWHLGEKKDDLLSQASSSPLRYDDETMRGSPDSQFPLRYSTGSVQMHILCLCYEPVAVGLHPSTSRH